MQHQSSENARLQGLVDHGDILCVTVSYPYVLGFCVGVLGQSVPPPDSLMLCHSGRAATMDLKATMWASLSSYLLNVCAPKVFRPQRALRAPCVGNSQEMPFCLCFSEARSVPIAVWLATGAFATENRGDLRLRYLVLSGAPTNALLRGTSFCRSRGGPKTAGQLTASELP